MTATPPAGVAARRRWAIRLIVRAIVAPNAITHAERTAVSAWLTSVTRGGELRHLDLDVELRKRAMKTEDFAAQVGVSARLVRYWRRGERTPSREMALRIGRVLGIGTARVLTSFVMRKDHATTPPPYDPSLPLLGRNLAAARALCKLTQKQLSAITGVPTSMISACESEHRSPATGVALLEVQYVIANRLRRRGYRTSTSVDRTRGRVRYHSATQEGEGSAPAAAD